jgi:hypothetical protein
MATPRADKPAWGGQATWLNDRNEITDINIVFEIDVTF